MACESAAHQFSILRRYNSATLQITLTLYGVWVSLQRVSVCRDKVVETKYKHPCSRDLVEVCWIQTDSGAADMAVCLNCGRKCIKRMLNAIPQKGTPQGL